MEFDSSSQGYSHSVTGSIQVNTLAQVEKKVANCFWQLKLQKQALIRGNFLSDEGTQCVCHGGGYLAFEGNIGASSKQHPHLYPASLPFA